MTKSNSRRLVLATILGLTTANALEAQGAPLSRRDRLDRDGVIWETRAWSVPYAADLPVHAKAAGVSRIWMEAKLNFPNFSSIAGIDWDSVYLSYLPRATSTRSTAEYYRVLQQMMAHLQDGHSDVFLPPALAKDIAAPPLRTDRIEDRLFITAVMSKHLEREGVVSGLELLRIDGETVDAYVERARAPLLTSNTVQHREVVRYSYDLLAGPSDTPVRLTLRRPNGQVFEQTVARAGYGDVTPYPRSEFRMLPGRIAYLALHSFASDSAQLDVERWLPAIRESGGLIIDVRQNSGGSGVVGYNILSRLIQDSFPIPPLRSRQYIAVRRAWGQAGTWWSAGAQKWAGSGPDRIAVPVVMLIGPRTLSAADVFTEAFRLAERGALIGEPTGGSTGDPLAFALPGGGVARISTTPNLGAVQPQVMVPRTIVDFLAGRDSALSAALARLASSRSPAR